jgi:signal transduction histidine kinase
LSQVWSNLIGNAIKFSDSKGKIDISLTCDFKRATVKITDYGIGMSEEVMQHIFEKFYQGDKTRSSQGNGLGLSLTKRIITYLKGK